MEIQQLNQLMVRAMKEIRETRDTLEQLAQNKADAEEKYQVALGQETYSLKEKNMSITLIKPVAEGNVANVKREKNLADELYKIKLKKLDALQSELSALQSIHRVQKDL